MSDVAFQQAGEFAAIRTQQTSSETNIITQLEPSPAAPALLQQGPYSTRAR
jgi:hypothetical protein